jgi:hypothetical protein
MIFKDLKVGQVFTFVRDSLTLESPSEEYVKISARKYKRRLNGSWKSEYKVGTILVNVKLVEVIV